MRIISFFARAFSVALVALFISWSLEGGHYEYRYIRAGEDSFNDVQKPLEVKPSFYPFASFLEGTTILLLGQAGEPYPAPYLTDTIIVASFRGNPLTLTLTSIPRDLLVGVPGQERYAKINSLYELGLTLSPSKPETPILDKVEEITGLPIDYVATIDVIGLEKIIDALGGIDVEIQKDIFDPSFPGPHYSYEPFFLSKGLQHLNGHDAVRFARSRHSRRGDFDRIERQQELLQALRDTFKGKTPPLHSLLTLFSSLDGHLKTNIMVKDMPLFLTVLLLRELPIETKTLEIAQGGLLDEIHTPVGAYALIPKAGMDDYMEIRAFFTREK